MFGLLLFCVLFCFASCLVTDDRPKVVVSTAPTAYKIEPLFEGWDEWEAAKEPEELEVLPPVEDLPISEALKIVLADDDDLEPIEEVTSPPDQLATVDDLKDKKWTVTKLRKLAISLPPGRKVAAPHKLSKAALTQRLLFSKVTLSELESLTA